MRRAFIVGNGPSLADTPLDYLKGEVSFACNRIRLIYPTTDWRPQYYIRAEGPELMSDPDPSLWTDDIRYHLELDGCEVWCNAHFSRFLGTTKHGALRLKTCTHYQVPFHSMQCPYTWHLPVACSYGSSVHVAMQIAVMEGYGPLYLIGCDLDFSDDRTSHFTPEYEKGYEGMLLPAAQANIDMLNAHIIARRSSPVPIYNASTGGKLEVYERVNYHALFRDRQRA